MNLEYLVFAILMLFTRLVYLRNDGPLSRWQTVGLCMVQVALLLLVFQWSLANMGAVLTVSMIAVLAVLTRNVLDPAKGYRLLGLIGLLVIPVYIGSFGQGFVFTPGFLAVVEHLHNHLPFLTHLDTSSVTRGCIVLLGLLLLSNETNIGIRAAFHHLKLEPMQAQDVGAVDRKEYNAGRMIGILERWLMLLVVVATNDLSALAFIIAAKGLARMKQLEDRQFAEYMLVGTLLSAVSAVLIGFWVKALLP